ncbi:spermidine synthase [Streptomyces sp. 4N509B]|uniref:spermidine synthase n=1 Tax=Streptomyces sp. 4N509B TaxID=3457413 RepID=UPI003FCF93BB
MTRTVDHGLARLLPDLDHANAWLLTVEDAPQSYVNLADPHHLEFEYVRRIAHVLDTVAPKGQPLDVLHLGGGALTLPRYVAATRPGSRQRVIEADGGLADLVAGHLPRPPGADITVQVDDALAAVTASPESSVDVVIADVYGGSRIPAHMTTLDCARACARVLRRGGVHVANLADAQPLTFLRSQLATLGAVFAETCLVAEPAMLRGRRFGNAVLVAGDAPLPVAELARRAAADAFPARTVDGEALARLTGNAAPVTTDAALPSPRPPRGALGQFASSAG